MHESPLGGAAHHRTFLKIAGLVLLPLESIEIVSLTD